VESDTFLSSDSYAHPYWKLHSFAIQNYGLYLEIHSCTDVRTVYRQFEKWLFHSRGAFGDLPIVAEISGSKVSFTNRSSKLQAENRIMIVSSFKLALPHKLSLTGIIHPCLWSQLMWKYCATGWAYYSSVFWQYLVIRMPTIYISTNQIKKYLLIGLWLSTIIVRTGPTFIVLNIAFMFPNETYMMICINLGKHSRLTHTHYFWPSKLMHNSISWHKGLQHW